MNTVNDNILEVRDLKQHFRIDRRHSVKAVDGVSFTIKRGSTFGLVGESGSGKSTIGRTVIRLYAPTCGSVKLNGRELGGKLTLQMKQYLTGRVQMIFQDPMASLNPRKKIIDIVAEGLDSNKPRGERNELVYAQLERVGLSREFAGRYPHMFSGGQRQRVGIARAIITDPELIIADECISALDMSIQAQVVNLMKDLQTERGLTYLFIAHDLSMVKYISDYIGVLHMGRLVESGTKDDIFQNPIHPYTKSLISAIPEPNPLTEPHRISRVYDAPAQGIVYANGTERYLTDTHMVLATDGELETWIA
ncbi:MAG: ATP-binding cassette domain-containing protein [Oscillospiraceae bacterium]|jgi:oligopeptide transport system ATP-binding protein|nr:ATP-binding cassette domain-containing protein [Oscillospiraceae bacterium]